MPFSILCSRDSRIGRSMFDMRLPMGWLRLLHSPTNSLVESTMMLDSALFGS